MKRQQTCPLLLAPTTYNPDPKIIHTTPEDRKYWLEDFSLGIVKTAVDKAATLNPNFPEAATQAAKCLELYKNYIEELVEQGSVRIFLEKAGDIFREQGFKDTWFLQKEKETELAVRALKSRLNFLDSIGNFGEKWCELAKGLAAGNVFDWGADEVQHIFDKGEEINLEHACDAIQKRPWFKDGVETFVKRLEVNHQKNKNKTLMS